MCFRNHGVPYGLCNSLSTLRLTVTGFNARLGTGGWLILTRYRLVENVLVLSSLYKKHQALLDALTIKFICRYALHFSPTGQVKFCGCKKVAANHIALCRRSGI